MLTPRPKTITHRAKEHELLPSNDIYCQIISLVPETKKQENNTLKRKVTMVPMQHIIKKLLILLFSTLKLFEVVIILRKI
jgi:hypothetical protein